MRLLIAALTALMFVGRALPAEALTLRDIGYWASENSQNVFWSIWNWLVEWWMFHHCLLFGACKFWDISIGFLLLDAFLFVSIISNVFAAVEGHVYTRRFMEWRLRRPHQKAAEQGNQHSQFWLGHFYFNRDNESADRFKAFYWFRRAAEQGHHQAQGELVTFYSDALAGPVANIKAWAWTMVSSWELIQNDPRHFEAKMSDDNLSPEQIAEAEKLASEYWEKYVVSFQKD
jgi:hypothetical protein